jgi:hypothetical protein
MKSRRISPGGLATILITIIWAFNVFAAVARTAFSDLHAVMAGLLSFPCCLLVGGAGFLSKRGVMQLDELYPFLIAMIPNAFLLGYGSVGLFRSIFTSNQIHPKSLPYSEFLSKNHKAEQDAP